MKINENVLFECTTNNYDRVFDQTKTTNGGKMTINKQLRHRKNRDAPRNVIILHKITLNIRYLFTFATKLSPCSVLNDLLNELEQTFIVKKLNRNLYLV